MTFTLNNVITEPGIRVGLRKGLRLTVDIGSTIHAAVYCPPDIISNNSHPYTINEAINGPPEIRGADTNLIRKDF